MIDGTAVMPGRHRVRFTLMAVASFLLYALGVLTLHQDRAPGWTIEAQGPIPAAVSYLIYGTPLGAIDENVFKEFMFPHGTVQSVLAATIKGSVPRGATEMYSNDGIGAGTNLFATAAMWMFGISISSFVLLYLVVVGISAFAFVLRYQDKRLIVVPLYFLVVTVMLLTPLCTSAAAISQMPIGGQRYFVLAALLPALHIFFEIMDDSGGSGRQRTIANLLLLLTQGLVLFGALLVRSSAGYLLGALLIVLIWRLDVYRKQRKRIILLAGKSVTVGAAFAFWAVFVLAILPAYVHTGRVLGNFWHRAFISFSLHPDWPFGDLRKVYDCTKYIPEGLSKAAADRNGHCVWWAYPPNANHPDGANQRLYGGEYERVLRNAYFYVLFHYPKQAFQLYFSVKTGFIKDVLVAAWRSLFRLDRAPVAHGLFAIAATQVLLFITFFISIAAVDLTIVEMQMAIFPIFFIFSLAPLYVAWATPWTSVDAVVLMYGCLVLAALTLVQLVARAIASGALPASQGILRKTYARSRT